MGDTLRSKHRWKGEMAKRSSTAQGGRTKQFAEFPVRATTVLGSREAAERWLERPAIGLDRACPIDLLATPTGAKMVDELLTRIEYGVYT